MDAGSIHRKRNDGRLASIVLVQQEIATADLDLNTVMRLIAERAQDLTDASGAVVELLEGDEMVYRAASGTASASLGLRLKAATSFSGLCVRVGESLRCDDSESDERVDRDACRLVGLRSMIVVPLVHKREIVGVLKVLSTERAAFGDGDLQVLHLMAGLLASSMSKAAAFDAERELVAERTRALRDTEQRFRLLVEGVRDYAIVMLDAGGHVASWNAGAERMFGYKAGEIVGCHCSRLLPPDHGSEGMLRAAEADGGIELEECRVRKDGSRFRANSVVTVLRDDGGRVLGFAKVVRDVTEQRRLEEQLRQAQKMEAVGQLAAGVAHDFNNLLTIISGYSELAVASLPPGDSLREMIEEIYGAGERAAQLTRQLLSFSRKTVVQPKVIDLNQIVSEAGKLLQRLIGEHVHLSTALAADLGRVHADPGQVEQVVINLAVNARDAMPYGGKLTIETSNVDLDGSFPFAHFHVPPGRYAMLAVSDTGVGMDEKTRTRVFEPFFTTKEPGKGTGLGLATVYGIVKQSGGGLLLYSEPGYGTTFKIYLPLVGDSTGDAGAGREELPPLHGDETVLLVEDEPGVRSLTRTALQTYGYRVLEAGRGDEALKISERHEAPIDLLLTDVVVPGLSGRQLAEKLKSRHPSMEVLFASGYTDDAIVRHGMLESRAAFLQKPFTPMALAAKVRETLDRRTSPPLDSAAIATPSVN